MDKQEYVQKVQKTVMNVKNIVVVYPNGVVANKGVSLDIRKGEILGILGENGAGKTTLMKVISGRLRPNSGEIYIEGRKVQFRSARDALKYGIAMVPQHPQLFGGLSVLEDLGLSLKLAGISISRERLKSKIEEIEKKYGINIDLEAKIWRLSMGERQKVDLIRTILLGKKVIILDEPTTHLTPMESEKLINIMKKLSEEGRAVLFITHKLKEALTASDRIAVMRKGKVVGIVRKEEASEELLIKLMFGDKIDSEVSYMRTQKQERDKVLEVINLWVKGPHGTWSLRNINLRVFRNEIVGVAGVAGNGQRELFEVLLGLRKASKGRIVIKGVDVTKKAPLYRRLLGLAVIPEERLGWALVPGKSIFYNVALGLVFDNKSFLIDWKRYKTLARKAVEMFDIKLSSVDDPVDSLSGGNMQKVIVARELLRSVDLVLAMNPTAGLDFKATLTVRRTLASLKSRGSSILLISEDLDELMELSDRIYVMSRGMIKGPFERPFSLKEIAKAMTT